MRSIRPFAALCTAALLLSACAALPQQADQPSPTPPPEAAVPTITLDLSQPTPTPEIVPPLRQNPPQPGVYERLGGEPYDVELVTSDLVKLAGTLYPPAKAEAPVLLLVTGLQAQRLDWQAFAGRSQAAGYAALAIDLRGHGGSGGKPAVELMERDLEAALDWLASQEGGAVQQVVIVGESEGANLAARVGARRDLVRGVVMLWPAPEEGEAMMFAEALKARPDLDTLAVPAPESAEGGLLASLDAESEAATQVLDWIAGLW
jgi:pimeloyl-ACP methyl ester carboxylesterase